jgi:hypothetical protein
MRQFIDALDRHDVELGLGLRTKGRCDGDDKEATRLRRTFNINASGEPQYRRGE